MSLILLLILLLLGLVDASSVFTLQVPKTLWDKPKEVRSLLLDLQHKKGFKFWGVTKGYQYIVSTVLSPAHRNLETHNVLSFDIDLKGLSGIIVITSKDDVTLFDLFDHSFDWKKYFSSTIQDSYHHGTRNALILEFNEKGYRHSKMLLQTMAKSQYVITIDKLRKNRPFTYHAIHFGIHGTETPLTQEDYGQDSIVTIGDTGLDTDHPYFHSSNHEVPRYKFSVHTTNLDAFVDRIMHDKTQHPKILAYISLEFMQNHNYKFTDFDDDHNGHGTHVAGSVVPGTIDGDITEQQHHSRSRIIFFDFQRNGEKHSLDIPTSIVKIMTLSKRLGSKYIYVP